MSTYWSLRLARSHYCQQLTLSVCLSVCPDVCPSVRLSRSFKLFLLFCFSVESSHFWPSVLHVALYKTLFFDFWFRPPNAKNLLPKIFGTISPVSRRAAVGIRIPMGIPIGMGWVWGLCWIPMGLWEFCGDFRMDARLSGNALNMR